MELIIFLVPKLSQGSHIKSCLLFVISQDTNINSIHLIRLFHISQDTNIITAYITFYKCLITFHSSTRKSSGNEHYPKVVSYSRHVAKCVTLYCIHMSFTHTTLHYILILHYILVYCILAHNFIIGESSTILESRPEARECLFRSNAPDLDSVVALFECQSEH